MSCLSGLFLGRRAAGPQGTRACLCGPGRRPPTEPPLRGRARRLCVFVSLLRDSAPRRRPGFRGIYDLSAGLPVGDSSVRTASRPGSSAGGGSGLAVPCPEGLRWSRARPAVPHGPAPPGAAPGSLPLRSTPPGAELLLPGLPPPYRVGIPP